MLHGRHEAIAPPPYGEQVAFAVAGPAHRLAQRGNVHLNVVFFHLDCGPDLLHDLVFGHQMTMAADEQEQNFERALADRHGDAVGQELTLLDQQAEWSKRERLYPRHCHGQCVRVGSGNSPKEFSGFSLILSGTSVSHAGLMTKSPNEDVEQIERLEAENERLRAATKEAQEAIEKYSASGPGSIDFDAILARLRAALRRHNDPS
jgi:hypothetical protein